MNYKEKYLYFTNGGGSTDPLNWSRGEMALYPVSMFKGVRPHSGSAIDLFFEGGSKVRLTIKNGFHAKITLAIANAIANSASGVIAIADVDSNLFIDRNILAVEIF